MQFTPLVIIQAIMAAISAAPQVVELVTSGKKFIQEMFKAGLITKETQDSTDKYMTAITEAAKAGIIPPSFQVQPDPE